MRLTSAADVGRAGMNLGRLVLASLILLTPTLAAADDQRAAGKPGKHQKHKRVKKLLRKFDKMIVKLDRDGDGRLGPDEVGDRFARFAQFDADGDGWVTRDEIIIVMKDRVKARKARRAQRATAP
jgi:hypothetical protein